MLYYCPHIYHPNSPDFLICPHPHSLLLSHNHPIPCNPIAPHIHLHILIPLPLPPLPFVLKLPPPTQPHTFYTPTSKYTPTLLLQSYFDLHELNAPLPITLNPNPYHNPLTPTSTPIHFKPQFPTFTDPHSFLHPWGRPLPFTNVWGRTLSFRESGKGRGPSQKSYEGPGFCTRSFLLVIWHGRSLFFGKVPCSSWDLCTGLYSTLGPSLGIYEREDLCLFEKSG